MSNQSNSTPLEIERKYLIPMPDEARLSVCSSRRIGITQTYLSASSSGYGRRVRASEENGSVTYTLNEKRRISDLVREEYESEITSAEYEALLKEADPQLDPVCKTRWCIPFEGHTLEIDIYPFWTDRAILEVELTSPDESVILPDWLGRAHEVTSDPRYLNINLARSVVTESVDSLF